MPQNQNIIPPILVSRRTNRLLELGGNNHSYGADQLRNMGVPIQERITRDISMVSMGISNETLEVFRQQIDHSNHEMVNTLTNHMASILNPMVRMTNESYQQMNAILTRIGNSLAIPRNQLGNRHIIQEIPVQERPNNNNNNKKDETYLKTQSHNKKNTQCYM